MGAALVDTGGVITVILRHPRSLVTFFEELVPHEAKFAPPHAFAVLRSMVAGVVLTVNPRLTLTVVGRTVFTATRDKSNISRLLTRRDFRSRDLHWESVLRVLRKLAPKGPRRREWHLALDGTAITRGADTKIKGAIRPDKGASHKTKKQRKQGKQRKGTPRGKSDAKSSKKKGRKTKYHTFLVANLTTHKGVRVPLPRYTCDPKDFKRQGGQKSHRDTQIDLAMLLIKRTLDILPDGVHLVVTADSYFECAKLVALAKDREFVLITPTDSDRCFADETTPPKSNGQRIRDYGLEISSTSWNTFNRLDLRRGSEKTVSYRRYSKRQQGPKDRRTYWLRHEERTVAGLGTVGVVYSWKTPVYKPKRNFREKSFKILICSDPSWTPERVVEWYELRWTAIEILIRELKQGLGLADFTGQNLDALERWIDTVLLSLLYLEMERYRILEDATSPAALRERVATARTQGMQEVVQAEANRDLLQVIRDSYRSERKRRLLMRFFKEIGQTRDVLPRAA